MGESPLLLRSHSHILQIQLCGVLTIWVSTLDSDFKSDTGMVQIIIFLYAGYSAHLSMIIFVAEVGESIFSQTFMLRLLS